MAQKTGGDEPSLQSKQRSAIDQVNHYFTLENELLKQVIEERIASIQSESDLDSLIDLLSQQPTLASLVAHLPEASTEIEPEDVLDFWFGEINEHGLTVEYRSALWWGGGEEIDALIKAKFEPLVEQLANGEHDDWFKTPEGRLAAIITFDQFTRNVFRGTPRAFAYDAKAQHLCLEGIEMGLDQGMLLHHRVFFYLPLEHAEDRGLQEQSLQLYEQLLAESTEETRQACESYVNYAVRHKVIVDRFGYYPHRNKIFGRASTPEEIEFLKEPGSSF